MICNLSFPKWRLRQISLTLFPDAHIDSSRLSRGFVVEFLGNKRREEATLSRRAERGTNDVFVKPRLAFFLPPPPPTFVRHLLLVKLLHLSDPPLVLHSLQPTEDRTSHRAN